MAGGRNRPGARLPAWVTAASAQARERRVHCWVDLADGCHPGIVVEWARDAGGWTARVAWTSGEGALLCAWVDASCLAPA